MKREKFGLEHQEVISDAFKRLDLKVAQYSFANLYLYRAIKNLEVIFSNDLWITGSEGNFKYVIPAKVPTEWNKEDVLFFLKEGYVFYPLPEEWSVYFDTFTSKEEDKDYLFLIEKFKNYAGRDLSRKRNLVKQFVESYSYEVVLLTQELADDALEVLDKWELMHFEADYLPCKEALKLFSILKLNGLIFYVDEKPVGFTIGTTLNSEMYVLLFAKGDTEYKGIYSFMYQEVAKSLSDKFKYLNLECDLGVPALRKAKHSYHPEGYALKMRVVHSPRDVSSNK